MPSAAEKKPEEEVGGRYGVGGGGGVDTEGTVRRPGAVRWFFAFQCVANFSSHVFPGRRRRR